MALTDTTFAVDTDESAPSGEDCSIANAMAAIILVTLTIWVAFSEDAFKYVIYTLPFTLSAAYLVFGRWQLRANPTALVSLSLYLTCAIASMAVNSWLGFYAIRDLAIVGGYLFLFVLWFRAPASTADISLVALAVGLVVEGLVEGISEDVDLFGSNGILESTLAFPIGVVMLYFLHVRRWERAAIAGVLLFLAFKRITFLGVGLAVAFDVLVVRSLSLRNARRVALALVVTLSVLALFSTQIFDTMDNGKVFIGMEDGWWDAFDEHTGALLWKTPNMAETSPWGEFWSYSAASHDGILYTNSYVGAIAFNESNGKIVWQTPSYSVPYETPYSGEYSWHSSSIVADGKYYSFTCEHSPTQPLTRGWKFYCLNATTGVEIWSILGTQRDSRNFDGAIADGYLAIYDQYIDATTIYGKGQSTTTITTPDVAVPQGTEVIIKGTVLDMSTAQPNTPCVSSASMATQMAYLHYGQPIGGIWGNETITGVPVTLKAIDSNNNLLDVGTTTTNGYYGTYSISWTPPNPGKYEILASFAGDTSYGSSGASAGLFVNTAPTSTPTTKTTSAPNLATTTDLMLYIVAAAIAIIIAIAIATVLLFRKK